MRVAAAGVGWPGLRATNAMSALAATGGSSTVAVFDPWDGRVAKVPPGQAALPSLVFRDHPAKSRLADGENRAPVVEYRYELRCGDEVVATGHLSREQPYEVAERVAIGIHAGVVRTVEPTLGGRELRLVVQLTREAGGG